MNMLVAFNVIILRLTPKSNYDEASYSDNDGDKGYDLGGIKNNEGVQVEKVSRIEFKNYGK